MRVRDQAHQWMPYVDDIAQIGKVPGIPGNPSGDSLTSPGLGEQQREN